MNFCRYCYKKIENHDGILSEHFFSDRLKCLLGWAIWYSRRSPFHCGEDYVDRRMNLLPHTSYQGICFGHRGKLSELKATTDISFRHCPSSPGPLQCCFRRGGLLLPYVPQTARSLRQVDNLPIKPPALPQPLPPPLLPWHRCCPTPVL